LKLLVLYAHDLEKTREFCHTIGVSLTFEKHGDGAAHLSFLPPESVAEVFPANSSSLSEFGVVFGFEVESLSEACERLDALGAKRVRSPAFAGGMHRAVFLDPDGRAVLIFETARANVQR
jgi:glyoxalase/bleomycin resistance protein/dioxygenase superfamily protein